MKRGGTKPCHEVLFGNAYRLTEVSLTKNIDTWIENRGEEPQVNKYILDNTGKVVKVTSQVMLETDGKERQPTDDKHQQHD